MRCKISIRKNSTSPLFFDYQYALASLLYARLAAANIRLANAIHSHQGFKFYTFSNLQIIDWIPNKNGLDFTSAYFIISSPDAEFIRSFAEGLLLEPEFQLGRHENKIDFLIDRIEILPQPDFADNCTFKTISPIYIKTMRKQGEHLAEVDLYPKDPKFYENLHNNLTSRYKEYFGHEIESDYFEVIDVGDVKAKRISIGNSMRRCSHMTLTLQAHPELIMFAYEAGLGEKNAMGFGCVDVVND